MRAGKGFNLQLINRWPFPVSPKISPMKLMNLRIQKFVPVYGILEGLGLSLVTAYD